MPQARHPDHHPVADRAVGFVFLTRSTATGDQKARTVDAEGRIARFERRYGEGTTP